MKKIILTFSFLGFLLSAVPSVAQDFNSAIGVRFGYPMSVSYKKFISESSALEAYVGTRGSRNVFGNSGYRWWSVSGAYQIHKPLEIIEEIDRLHYYYGIGASAFLWNFDFSTDSRTTTFGIQGYAGVSYTFEDTPVNISVDWVPSFLFSGYISGFGADYGSLSVRYVIGGGD